MNENDAALLTDSRTEIISEFFGQTPEAVVEEAERLSDANGDTVDEELTEGVAEVSEAVDEQVAQMFDALDLGDEDEDDEDEDEDDDSDDEDESDI